MKIGKVHIGEFFRKGTTNLNQFYPRLQFQILLLNICMTLTNQKTIRFGYVVIQCIDP
jgi:hypothetical protein